MLLMLTRIFQTSKCNVRCHFFTHPRVLNGFSSPSISQHANLTSTYGEPAKRKHKPWPYERKIYGARLFDFNVFWSIFDNTYKRFDDNSKIIVVDGNIAVGKTDFAKKLAKQFDMKYVADAKDDMAFAVGENFDYRFFNEQLPPRLQYCDIKSFMQHDGHPDFLKGFGRTLCRLFRHSFQIYVNALIHLFNTGQGIVMDRCAFSHNVFHHALTKCGHLSKNAMEYMQFCSDMTVCDLLRPHLVIYLDNSIQQVRESIKKRNVAWEVDSPVLSDHFLTTMDDTYTQDYLPKMQKFSQIIKFDPDDVIDINYAAYALEKLDLGNPEIRDLSNVYKFKDWNLYDRRDFDMQRLRFSDPSFVGKLFCMGYPWDAPELMIDDNDLHIIYQVIDNHPEVFWAPGFNPEKHNVLFKL